MKKRLTGLRCQCAACGLYFSTVRAFDLHRRGSYIPDKRRCLTTTEMARILHLDPKGIWVRPRKIDAPRRVLS
jgi:hypothetical protein